MRVLAYTSPAKGHLFPVLPTLAELRRRGHHVALCTLAGEVERAGALGLAARPMAPAIEAREIDDWRATSPLGAAKRALTTWLDRAPHEVEDLRAAIATVRPDVLLVDVNAWGAVSAAEASGLPFAIFSPYFADFDIPGRPPFGLGLAPRSGLLGALRDRILRFVSGLAFRPLLARLNALRRDLGVAPLSRVGDIALRGHRLLYFTADAFEYDHGGWPDSVRFVGAGLWEPPAPAEAPRPTRPLALITCSTEFQDDGRLVEMALEALAGEDLDVVATTGAIDPASFRAPQNARIVRYAPHSALLPHAAVVVCHGGMGITQKALAAGVPVCAVPFGRDQNDVARHLEAHGVGTSVPARALTAGRLREAIREARKLTGAAARMAAAFARAAGPEGAAVELEALAGVATDRARGTADPPDAVVPTHSPGGHAPPF